MRYAWVGMMLALGLAAPATAQDGQKATASFIDGQGKTIGSATLIQTPNGVLITLDLKGIPAGEHAFHVHEKGVCNAADKFMSAGGHYNPGRKQHGYLTAGGTHAGDMPNQFVGADGVLKANVLNEQVTLGSGTGTLFGGDGTALVLHAKGDDYKSQPAGDAGGRIACAVVKK
ncbi:MAG: superoxide dismutase family protein [Rhizobiales bacterium]|nr:superoxide dismutase family protein [Hyphomicrobiales bacterium]